jgi:putative hydrolase of the HAD superfamily
MLSAVAAVLFDFDHTLGIDNHLEERVIRLLCARHGLAEPSDAEIAYMLRTFRSGEVRLGTMLRRAFTSWGCDRDVEDEYKADALALMPTSVVANPGASETLEQLAGKGVLVGILTNGWAELQRAKARQIGFFGPVYASEEIGAWKPEREAFEIAANAIGAAIERCAYVGDNPQIDVAGAKAAGMRAVWARLEDQRYPEGVVEPDAVVTRLTDLLDLIRSR